MSNKRIYTNHYVYLIEHIQSGKYYIGVRTTKLSPEDDLGKKYFSSSSDKEFVKDQKLNKDHYKYVVLKEFDNRHTANLYEIFLHDLYKVHIDSMAYNRAIHTSTGFCVSGNMPAKDKDGNIFHVSVNDERLKTGELVHVNAGMMIAKDTNGNNLQVSVNDERLKTGELVGIAAGMFAAKDIDGNTYYVSVDDPRLKTGELVSVNAGMMTAKDIDGNIYHVSVDDERLKTGELVSIHVGMRPAKDIDGNTYFVSVNDERLKTGELVSIHVGMMIAKDKDGNNFYVSVNDERLKTGELVGVNAGRVQVYDNNDKRHSINKNDYDPDVYYRIPRDYKKCKDADGNILILWDRSKRIKNGEVQVAKPAISGKDTYLVFPDDPRILDGTLEFKVRKKIKR